MMYWLGQEELERGNIGRLCFATTGGIGPLTAILVNGFLLGRFLVLSGFVESLV
jgi:hypothetical protein